MITKKKSCQKPGVTVNPANTGAPATTAINRLLTAVVANRPRFTPE